MRTRNIPRDVWPRFFDSFSRRHAGWSVTAEVFAPEFGAQVQSREMCFDGIVDEWDEIGGDHLVIMIGEKPGDHITHIVDNPKEVALEQTDEGMDAALAIKSRDGVTVLLHFELATGPELVKGETVLSMAAHS